MSNQNLLSDIKGMLKEHGQILKGHEKVLTSLDDRMSKVEKKLDITHNEVVSMEWI